MTIYSKNRQVQKQSGMERMGITRKVTRIDSQILWAPQQTIKRATAASNDRKSGLAKQWKQGYYRKDTVTNEVSVSNHIINPYRLIKAKTK